jgi:hypothetical protein
MNGNQKSLNEIKHFIIKTRKNTFYHKSRSPCFIQNISDHINTALDNMTKHISYNQQLEELASSKNDGNIQASYNNIEKNVINDHGISIIIKQD